jgi:hypothetical protein
MNQLAARFSNFWTAAVTLRDAPLAAPEAAFGSPRPLTGFYAGLTAEQKKLALEHDGDETHGDPQFLRRRA